MAMTKTLWSLNAIATELGYDRRTVGLALREVRPDGKLKGHPAWYLETALSAVKMNAKRARPERRLQRSDILIETLISRNEDWREIHVDNRKGHPDHRFTIAETAEAMGVEPGDVLVWLRAGCPYVVEGDWKMGRGFELKPVWTIEWTSLVYARCATSGQSEAIRSLGMGRFGR